jgi:hypothetical protein
MVEICHVRFANFLAESKLERRLSCLGIQYEEKSVIAMVENTVSQGREWLANEANWLVRPMGFHDIRTPAISKWKMECVNKKLIKNFEQCRSSPVVGRHCSAGFVYFVSLGCHE